MRRCLRRSRRALLCNAVLAMVAIAMYANSSLNGNDVARVPEVALRATPQVVPTITVSTAIRFVVASQVAPDSSSVIPAVPDNSIHRTRDGDTHSVLDPTAPRDHLLGRRRNRDGVPRHRRPEYYPIGGAVDGGAASPAQTPLPTPIHETPVPTASETPTGSPMTPSRTPGVPVADLYDPKLARSLTDAESLLHHMLAFPLEVCLYVAKFAAALRQ